MADTATAEATAEGGTSAADADQTEPKGAQTTEGEGSPEGEAKTQEKLTLDQIRQALDDGDISLDELVQVPKVAGKIGAHANKLAPKIAEEQLKPKWLQEFRAGQEQARLDSLLETDAEAYADEVKRLKAAGANRKQIDAVANRAYETTNAALSSFLGSLPAPVQKAITEVAPPGKRYDGTYADGVKGWLADLVEGVDKFARADAEKSGRAKFMKEELPALKKAWLSEQSEGEETPDVGGGRGDASTDLSPEQWSAMTREQRQKLKAEDPKALEAAIQRWQKAA